MVLGVCFLVCGLVVCFFLFVCLLGFGLVLVWFVVCGVFFGGGGGCLLKNPNKLKASAVNLESLAKLLLRLLHMPTGIAMLLIFRRKLLAQRSGTHTG